MLDTRFAGNPGKTEAEGGAFSAGRWTILAWLVSAAAFGFYLYLAWRYPAMYWFDAHDRMALRNQVLVGRWLPVTQFIVFLVSKVTLNLLVLRGVLAGIAALTVMAMFRLGRQSFNSAAGMISATLLASNLIFSALATVPYPDVVFIGPALIALYYLERPSTPRNLALGMLALNLACLTRYEGWMLAGIIVADTAVRSLRKSPWKTAIRNGVVTAALAGAAPLAWLILGVSVPQGLIGRLGAVIGFEQARPGTNPFIPSIDPGYLRDFAVNFYHLLRVQCGLAVLLAGSIGWLIAIYRSPSRSLHVRVALFVVMDWCLLALWRPWPFSNLRQAFITQVFVMLYAGYGLQQFVQRLSVWIAALTRITLEPFLRNGATGIIAASMIVVAVPNSARFVSYAAHGTDFYVPEQVGAWLNTCVEPGDGIWVLSDDIFPAYALATYTDRPLADVLDHRFDEASIRGRLSAADQVYVVGIFRSSADLAAPEHALLYELEGGQIAAQRFTVASVPVWVVSTAEILPYLASK